MRRAARLSAAAALSALLVLGAAEALWRGVEYADCRRRAHGDAGAFDLFVVGESTARGYPYDRDGGSLAALIAAHFDARLAGRPMIAITIAESGSSIYPQSAALERALLCRDPRRPGAAILYTGHNDEGLARGDSPLMRLERLLPRSRLLEAVFLRLERRWPSLRVRTLDTWEFHLRRALAACRRAGVAPILALPVSDAVSVDPGLSSPSASREELAAFARRALALGDAGRCAELDALAPPEGAAAYHDYRRARCEERAGRPRRAAELYARAVDRADRRSFGRATSLQLARLRAIAAESGVRLADASAAFARGGALFVDAQHPTLEGYRFLADAYARELSAAFSEPLRPASPPGWCDARCRAEALSSGGWWLLTVSSDHPAPRERLSAARLRFRQALEEDPRSFTALLGLSLADDAERTDMLNDRTTLAWMGRMGLFFTGPRDLDDARFAEVLARLRANGARPAQLAALERARRDGLQSPHGHQDRPR